jgi:hypothetical protein
MTDGDYSILNISVDQVFDNGEIDDLASLYGNPLHTHAAAALIRHAAKENFHFDLFMSLIPRFRAPNSVLNAHLKNFYGNFYEKCRRVDIDLLDKLVQFAATLSQTAKLHALEKLEIDIRYHQV